MAISPARGAIYGVGSVGIAAFVFKMLAVDYPDGDPAKARQAAAVWTRLAERLEQSQNRTYPFAEAVWKRNGGEGIEAYKKAVTAGLYPNPPALGYADKLAQRCRQNSEACLEYAEVIEKAQHAYWSLALANLASFMFITTFPWQAGVAYKITEIAMNRAKASLLAKLVEHNIGRIVLSKLTEYSIGSAFFAVGDVGVVAGVNALRGEDTGSWSDNGKQMLKEFTASVAFYGAFEGFMPAARAMSKNADVQYFISRMVGGSTYGATYDALNGESGTDLVPTWKQTLGRALLYFTMAHKPAE
ncbi:hypothetical protein [Nonomuraea sp. NPDC048901]|uniref:WXG100-like domain-containing protein n=1 Tax=Nonomuraea sp. NPDC048901 TaxID=3155627 RepID=UPI0033E0FAD3